MSTTTEQDKLDDFIKRVGFEYGWSNLESWARHMAVQAIKELDAVAIDAHLRREVVITDDQCEGALKAMEKLGYAGASDVECMRAALESALGVTK